MDLIILCVYGLLTIGFGLTLAFLGMLLLEWMWEKLRCRACNRMSWRAFKHSYCASCHVQIDSDLDCWITEIRKGEGQWI